MNFLIEFLLNFLKTLVQVFIKTCAEKQQEQTTPQKKKGRKRTTSISKTTTENFQIETFSTSASSSETKDNKKET